MTRLIVCSIQLDLDYSQNDEQMYRLEDENQLMLDDSMNEMHH
jgi:hypothetical protein